MKWFQNEEGKRVVLPIMAVPYKDLKNNPKALVSFTGYRKEEFEKLCNEFEQQWQAYITHYTLTGKRRNRAPSQKANNTFPNAEARLLFILHYWKSYPLQEVMGVTFGMKQPQVNLWLGILRPLLKKTLKAMKMLPERQAGRVKEQIKKEKQVIIDGTERAIQRPSYYEDQKDYYSGKKNGTR